MVAPLFRRIKRNIFVFEVLDIYHMKNQTENMFTAFSFLLLKIPFHFIPHCISEPHLEKQIVPIRK